MGKVDKKLLKFKKFSYSLKNLGILCSISLSELCFSNTRGQVRLTVLSNASKVVHKSTQLTDMASSKNWPFFHFSLDFFSQ